MSKLVMLLLGLLVIGIAGDAAAADPVGCFNVGYGPGTPLICKTGRDKLLIPAANLDYGVQNLTDKIINVAIFDVHIETSAIIEFSRFPLPLYGSGGGNYHDDVSTHRLVIVWCEGYPNLIKNEVGAAIAVCT